MIVASQRTSATSATTTDAASTSPNSTPADNQALLPAPSQPASDAVLLDSAAALFAMLASERENGLDAEKVQIESAKLQRDGQMRKMFEAQKKEAEARAGRGLLSSLGKLAGDLVSNVVTLKPGRVFTDTGKNLEAMVDSPNFWRDLGKVATTVTKVAAAAVAVVSLIGGPAAVGGFAFAAGVISAVAMVESQFNILEKVGMSSDAVMATRMSMAGATLVVGGAGLVANLATTASTASSTTSQATRAAQTAGDAAQKAALQTASKTSELTRAATATGTVVAPTTQALAKGAEVGEAVHLRNAEFARAQAETHRYAKDHANQELHRRASVAVDNMEDHEALLGVLRQILVERNQTTLSLASGIGGRA